MAEFCVGCDHDMRMHFTSATGEVVCLMTDHGVSSSGVLGIAYHHQCDCVNYASPAATQRRTREAAEKARRDAWRQDIVDAVLAKVQDPEGSNPNTRT